MYVGNYILARLKELGVHTFFGCTGDFAFGMCDLIDDSPDMNWAGNTNELNGAYAAEAYSRIHGFGALITTWGVGELSAINGVAGAYAERYPLLHIAGFPPQSQSKHHLPVHHSLADGNYKVYAEAASKFACAVEFLDGTVADADRIDHVLRMAVHTRRPAYIALPTTVTFAELPEELLKSPLLLKPAYTKEYQSHDESIAREIVRVITNAKSPVIITDVRVVQYRFVKQIQDFVECLGFPALVTPLAKSLIDETASYFAGLYNGKQSSEPVAKLIEEADVILRIGYFETDVNTGGFSATIPADRLIELNIEDVSLFQQTTHSVRSFGDLLEQMTSITTPRQPAQVNNNKIVAPTPMNSPISQRYLWGRIATYIKPGDVIVAETGTSSSSISSMPLRKHCQLLSQQLYYSIGWSVGATTGVAHALRDGGEWMKNKSGRVILFVGDGSLQMTVQDISALVRMRARNVLICILNNDGYTIERILHGPSRTYNNIVRWDYSQLTHCFDPAGLSSQSFKVTSETELNCILEKLESDFPLTVLDMHINKMDAPEGLRANSKAMRDKNLYGYASEYLDTQ